MTLILCSVEEKLFSFWMPKSLVDEAWGTLTVVAWVVIQATRCTQSTCLLLQNVRQGTFVWFYNHHYLHCCITLLAHPSGLWTNSQICLSVKSWKPGSTSSFYKYSLYLCRVVRGTSVHVSAVKPAPLKSTVFKTFWVDTWTSFSITSFLNSLRLYCCIMFPWSVGWIKFITFEEQAMEDDTVVIHAFFGTAYSSLWWISWKQHGHCDFSVSTTAIRANIRVTHSFDNLDPAAVFSITVANVLSVRK